jgi:hypothetical protein
MAAIATPNEGLAPHREWCPVSGTGGKASAQVSGGGSGTFATAPWHYSTGPAAAWETVNGIPPITIVPVLAGPVFAAATHCRDPGPVSPSGVTVSQAEKDCAFHSHFATVLTTTCPLPPPATTAALLGDSA